MGPTGYQSEFVGAFRFVLQIFTNWVYAMFIFFRLTAASDFAGGAVIWRGQKGLTVGLGSGLARPYFKAMMRARKKKVRYILVDRFGGFYDRQLRLLSGVFR